MSDWKPGDVAMLTTGDRGFVNCKGQFVLPDGGTYWVEDGDARPLVVIDPEAVVFDGQADDDGDRITEIVNCLRRIAEADGGRNWRATLCLRLADEFERQNPKSPRPDEPQGLGAVVEDVDGVRWVQFTATTGRWWRNHIGRNARWSDLRGVRVLSEGVRP